MATLLLTLAAGALLAFSLPPFDLEWLGWIALAPLLVAVRGRRPLEAMGAGVLAGAVCGVVHIGRPPGAPGTQFAWLPFLWLAMLLGVVAAGSAAARERWSGARWALFVACLGVAAEWATTFTPLPLNLALCQYRTLPVLQIAALTGIWGVSFLLWWVNAALADAALGALEGRYCGRMGDTRGGGADAGVRTSVRLPWRSGKRTEVRTPACLREPDSTAVSSRPHGLPAHRLAPTLGPPLLALALALAYGQLSLSQARNRHAPRLRVAAIQDHTEAETAGILPAAAHETEEPDREALTRRAVARGAKLVVWSENCLGAAFTPGDPTDPTAALARELNAHLVVGYSDAARPRPFNCAGLLAPDGTMKGVHHKLHPFLGERQAVQRGRGATAFATDLGRVGMEICFDSCYTEPTRRLAADGARIIAMPNYDPPTPRGVLHRLHAAMLPFRAIENRVPFVRADPNGLSQIVDATGRIVAESPLFVADALVADVPLGDGHGTPFTRLGDWLVGACLVGVLVVALTAFRAGRSDLPQGDRDSRAS